MEDGITNLGELKERWSNLRTLRGHPYWRSFCDSLRERMAEVQSKVNDLGVTGDRLEAFRVRRCVLEELISQQMINGFVEELEGRIKGIEEAEENNKGVSGL